METKGVGLEDTSMKYYPEAQHAVKERIKISGGDAVVLKMDNSGVSTVVPAKWKFATDPNKTRSR